MSPEQRLDQLHSVRDAIDSWRKTKSYKGETMPDKLWKRVVELVSWFPVTRVAVTLRVNINKLKKEANRFGFQPILSPLNAKELRDEASSSEKAPSKDESRDKIEVTHVSYGHHQPMPRSPEPIRIIVRRDGIQLDLSIPSGHDPSLVASVVNSLLGRLPNDST